MHAGGDRGRLDPFARRLAVAEADVVAQRLRIEERLLQDDADPRAHGLALGLADIDAIDADRPRRWIVEPQQQADERRLARSRGPENGKRLARLDPERDLVQHRLPILIRERDAVELDLAAHFGRQRHRPRRPRFARFAQDFLDPPDRDLRFAHVDQNPPHVAQRAPQQHAQAGHVEEELTHRERIVLDEARADDQHKPRLRQAHQVRRRPVPRHQAHHAVLQVAVGGILPLELGDLMLLAGKRADDANPGQVLLQDGRHRGLRFVLLLECRLDAAEEEQRGQDNQRRQRERI
ncbi:MAG: hypothetical protein BWZ08_02425 [candidate division BRC1 bacterium ADurb.BinA292]|nr:MAG: hypothetical protein BWZ08_02425 [candidate division BRC1 bacterium ADurb.BinA292]